MTINITKYASQQKLLSNLPKHRNTSYMEFVREFGCIICENKFETHAHHVRMDSHAGTGVKPSDYLVVPLCHTHHSELHQHGEKSFWQRHMMPPHVAMTRFLTLYLIKHGESGIPEVIHLLSEAIENTRKGKFE